MKVDVRVVMYCGLINSTEHCLITTYLPSTFTGILPVWRFLLTHWGRVTHICVGNLTIIGSDNGLSPGRRQAIIWTNDIILLIGPLGTNFSEILIKIDTFSFKKMHLKMSSAKWRPFCLGRNVLNIPVTERCIRYVIATYGISH